MCVPWGVVVCGLDDTIECRRGDHLRAKGIYRDPVRSSHAHVVKVSGWRWRCWMLLTPRPWAGRMWALPFRTVLYPPERFYEPQGRRHQTLVKRAWPIIRVVVRWWPRRDVVVVADSRDAVREWRQQVSAWPRARLSTRRRLEPPAMSRPLHVHRGSSGDPGCKAPGARPWRPCGPTRTRGGAC
jgi:hypothetical protein